MTASRLAALLDQATKGEWEAHDQGGEINIGTMAEWVASLDTSYDVPFDRAQCEADARLIALAPDMARLLLDMAATLAKTIYDVPGYTGPRAWWADEAEALLARFAALEAKAGHE